LNEDLVKPFNCSSYLFVNFYTNVPTIEYILYVKKQKRNMAGTDVDVVIVGAGISGLSAAYKLLSKDPNLDIIVLEAKGNHYVLV